MKNNATSIDVGYRSHLVAGGQNKENVRSFAIHTKAHELLFTHLQNLGITSMAVESTGSYGQTLFNTLQRVGFAVILVGGRLKNVQSRRNGYN